MPRGCAGHGFTTSRRNVAHRCISSSALTALGRLHGEGSISCFSLVGVKMNQFPALPGSILQSLWQHWEDRSRTASRDVLLNLRSARNPGTVAGQPGCVVSVGGGLAFPSKRLLTGPRGWRTRRRAWSRCSSLPLEPRGSQQPDHASPGRTSRLSPFH